MRIRTICSRERAPKRLHCACIFDAPQKKHHKSKKTEKQKNKNINKSENSKIWPMQKQMLENYKFTRGSIVWECSHTYNMFKRKNNKTIAMCMYS